MDDKILIEDDIVDLTDLLEEGNPPSNTPKDSSQKKRVNEPDSFDLGKEISMEYDVSVEEIEQGSGDLGLEKSLSSETGAQVKPKEEDLSFEKEPLLDIEKEIDLAIHDKIEEVSLTSKEEEMLLQDELVEEPLPVEEKAAPVEPEIQSEPEIALQPEDTLQEAAIIEAEPLSVIEEKSILIESEIQASSEEAFHVVESTETEYQLIEEEGVAKPNITSVNEAGAAPSAVAGIIPAELITETLINELKKEMPSVLESVMKPLVKELLPEIISATRDALPSLVEKVIREEIEKLKRL
jgi:hypothetical protein